MWEIIKRELKDRKWSLLAYCLGSIAMLWLYVATFESSRNSTAQLQELIKTYPKALLEAIGLSNLSLDTIEKYLNAKHFSLLWPLLAIILALSRAGTQIAGEIQTGTMGQLLALPLQRLHIFFAKYIAGLTTVVVFAGISVFGVIPLAAAYGIPSHGSVLFSAWILTTLFMWSVYGLGLAVSSCVSDKGKVYAISSSIIIVSYLMYIIALINQSLASLKHYSMFYYFNTQEVLATGHIANKSWFFFGVVIVATTTLSAWKFNSRDISV